MHPGLIGIGSECAIDLRDNSILVELTECSIQMGCCIWGKHCVHSVTLNRVIYEWGKRNQRVIGKAAWLLHRIAGIVLLLGR